MAIRAPYNFVPVSDKVFFPDWADKISHDIPFKDGLSGTIELKITAETPIFVRNAHTRTDADEKNDNYTSFSNIDGKYFIPATSIKGCIRNVLEILSFSKMRLNEDMKFAQREWDNGQLYPLKQQQNNFRCGWLKRVNNKYLILDYGKPFRIAHTRIDEYIQEKYNVENVFKSKFSQSDGIDLRNDVHFNGKSFDPKTAAYKYELLKDVGLKNLNFKPDEEYCCEYKDNRLKVSDTGELKGTIVLTGQPDKWVFPRPQTLTRNAGKFYEFVFVEPDEVNKHELSEQEFNQFKFIYSDSAEWSRVSRLLNSNEGVPIFFRTKIENREIKIKDFGLAFLYKLPYEKTPYETLPEKHKSNSFDLADCIFGSIDKKPLKGRVQFSHAIASNAEIDNELIFTMGSPKASYYPIYIDQKTSNNKVSHYRTYNDGMIKGWKRYPAREGFWGNKPLEELNSNLDTKLVPLKKDTVFTCKIRYHNLKEIELGALISAITFHKKEHCFHQIGQGKPFGLGKVSVKLSGINNMNEDVQESLLAKFEHELIQKLGISSWTKQESIEHLFAMSFSYISQANADSFKYMKMSTTPANNEFLQSKNHNENFKYFPQSVRIGEEYKPVSFYEKMKDEINKKLEEEKKAADNKIEAERIAEIEKLKQQEAEKRQVETQSKLQGGPASYLEEKNLKDEYVVKDFKMLKAKVEKYLKDSGQTKISESEWEVLRQNIKRVYNGLKPRDQKDWQKFENNKIWNEIANWTSSVFAKELFAELI